MKITINEVTEIIKNANEVVSKANEVVNNASKAIEQFKTENPGIKVETLISEAKGLPCEFGQISSSEVNKFVAYAKEQGMKMQFDSIEMGILEAGRKDMKNGLAEVLNSMDTDRPICSGCNEEMDNRGRGKKKS